MLNIKRLFFLLSLPLFALISMHSLAQSVSDIKNSGNFYYGLGLGANYDAAKKEALRLLSESISVQIKSNFERIVVESGQDLESVTKTMVTTYSSTVVNNYRELLIQEEKGNFEVLLFITKADMVNAFKERENIIRSYIRTGLKAENERRIADALRYYYWALLLTTSHPDNNKLMENFGDAQQTPMLLGLTDKINSVLSRIQANIANIESKEQSTQKMVYLNFKFDGQLVQSLDYTYFDGMGYSGLFNAANGIAVTMLSDAYLKSADQIKLRLEYKYTHKADIDPEVKRIIENIDFPFFEKSELRVPIRQSNENTGPASLSNTNVIAVLENHIPEYMAHDQILKSIIDLVGKPGAVIPNTNFTEQGYEMFQKLITNGNVSVLKSKMDTLKMIKVGDEIMVRSVPMLFSFKNNRERFVEEVVFNFNSEAKINSLSYALSDIAIGDILKKPETFGSVEEKYLLIKFMEDFKTAYALKRLDFLEAVFDENALIIVGNMVKKSDKPSDQVTIRYGNLSDQQVEYIRMSKGQYIDRLRSIFARNEFINIRFEDNTVAKTQKSNKIYGIQIAQHYYSSSYADKGYLFLMIDLSDSLAPKVYVRTWQPEKNPDGSIYGLHDFKF